MGQGTYAIDGIIDTTQDQCTQPLIDIGRVKIYHTGTPQYKMQRHFTAVIVIIMIGLSFVWSPLFGRRSISESEIHNAATRYQRSGLVPSCSALSIFAMRRHISAGIKSWCYSSLLSVQYMAVVVSSMVLRHQYICHLVTPSRLTIGRSFLKLASNDNPTVACWYQSCRTSLRELVE
jgi:hypothetical protein